MNVCPICKHRYPDELPECPVCGTPSPKSRPVVPPAAAPGYEEPATRQVPSAGGAASFAGQPQEAGGRLWWRAYNMQPVGLCRLRLVIWKCFLLCCGGPIIGFLVGYLFGAVAYTVARDVMHEEYNVASGAALTVWPLAALLTMFLMFLWLRAGIIPNKLRRKRGELSDADFIELPPSRATRYAIVMRGNENVRQFGLFDVKKVRMAISPAYDALRWEETDKVLIGSIGGKEQVLDVNGKCINGTQL